MQDKIAPCPFCGGVKTVVKGDRVRYVVCCMCSATGPFAPRGRDDEAIRMWNEREEQNNA